jgi:peptidoglycan/xylan/chitin deacetylase (PgdA/CDA1 family)
MPLPVMLKSFAEAVFQGAGGLAAARWLRRGGLRILMYHRFPDRAGLERQCAHLRRYYVPLSLREVAARLQAGGPFPPLAVAVTVDDGYRDAAEVAQPVFAAYGIPATVFVVTRFLDGGFWLWGDCVLYACLHAARDAARVEWPSGDVLPLDLRDAARRRQSASLVKQRAKLLPTAQCLELVERLPRLLGCELPPEPPPEFAAMRWDDARRLAGSSLEIGSHTLTHPILSRLTSAADLERELAASRGRIEEQLDRECPHLCYPNGRRDDIGPRAAAAARAAGYRTAVTTESGLVWPGADPFDLRRIGVHTTYPDAHFARFVAAFRL